MLKFTTPFLQRCVRVNSKSSWSTLTNLRTDRPSKKKIKFRYIRYLIISWIPHLESFGTRKNLIHRADISRTLQTLTNNKELFILRKILAGMYKLFRGQQGARGQAASDPWCKISLLGTTKLPWIFYVLQITVVIFGPLISSRITLDPKMRGNGIAILMQGTACVFVQ